MKLSSALLLFFPSRYFNEMTSGRVFNPSSPSPYSPSPTRRSLSPGPPFLATVGYPPTSPLRGRAQSFGTYPHTIHGNPHMQPVSASHLSGVAGAPGVAGATPTHNNGSGSTSQNVSGMVGRACNVHATCIVKLMWSSKCLSMGTVSYSI